MYERMRGRRHTGRKKERETDRHPERQTKAVERGTLDPTADYQYINI